MAAEDNLTPADAEIGTLYRQHAPTLIRQIASSTGCTELARELANEAFVRFLRLPSVARLRIERPAAYLGRIAANLVRDSGRAGARRTRECHKIAGDEPVVDQLAVLESRDILRRLESAVAIMKPKTRAIFLAHRLDGLSYAEIAQRTGLSVKGVEKQMSKAIAMIDRLLDQH